MMCSSFYFGDSVTLYANMRKKNITDHNEVYIKTAICLYSSLRSFSEQIKLVFFVNDIQKLNHLKEGYYIKIFNRLQVEVVEVPVEFVDPGKPWAGSMYIFDILKYLINTEEQLEQRNKGYFFLDTDVVFFNNFNRVIQIVEKYDWAGYAQYCEFGRFNCWIENFLGINMEQENKVALPYGGEFLYLNSNTVKPFFEKFLSLYKDKGNFYVTEEHYYTTILNSEEFLRKKGMEINPFFKRAIRANRSLDDQYLWGVHFPGEKDYKLKYLFSSLSKNNFAFSSKKAKQILGLATFFNIYDFKSLGKIVRKIVRSIEMKWKEAVLSVMKKREFHHE